MTSTTTPRLYPTKNDLPEAGRLEVIALLNQRLADGLDLQAQSKQAHGQGRRVRGAHVGGGGSAGSAARPRHARRAGGPALGGGALWAGGRGAPGGLGG